MSRRAGTPPPDAAAGTGGHIGGLAGGLAKGLVRRQGRHGGPPVDGSLGGWRRRLVLAPAVALLLAGCQGAPRTRYHWAGYQGELYGHFQGQGDGSSPALSLQRLQAQADEAAAAGRPLPPGFRAHLGLLQLRLGDADGARRQFAAEKAAFPEAGAFMDFLLQRLPATADAAPATPITPITPATRASAPP